MIKEPTVMAPDARAADHLPIGAVVAELQLQHPEISASSLRFLEREGLVAPHRTPGGHRLYSRRDIQRVRQIKQLQSRHLTLAEIRAKLQLSSSPAVADLRERVLATYLDGRTRDAQWLLLSHGETDLDLATMFEQVLTPVLVEVGVRWAAGNCEVDQEKEITESIHEVIVDLSLRHRAPESSGPVIVAATVLGELHQLGLRMVCGVLGAAGFEVVYLGANAAPEHVREAVRRHQPATVLLSCGSDDRFPAVQATIDLIAALSLSQKPQVLIGGASVAGHEDAIVSMGATPIAEQRLADLPTLFGELPA